jgi:serine protease AprX
VYPQVDTATTAWASGNTGRGVTVAVVDTGVSPVGDLAGKVVGGFDFSGEGDFTHDSYGHGTFVAGVIAGTGAASGGAVQGVAPGANLVSLKVAGADGSSDVVRVLGAMGWAIAHRDAYNIRVLNLSLGTTGTQSWRVDPLDYAVEQAWRAGIVVTVSAGNSGPNPGSISKPGDDPLVITVGATDDQTTISRGDDTVAGFSSVGPTSAGVAKPDLVAPGAHVVSVRAPGSTIDGAYPTARVGDTYFRGSGTSFAAPQAAGAAALLLATQPASTPDQVKAQLTAGAAAGPVSDPARVGAGALDVAGALAATDAGSANQGVGGSDGSGTLAGSTGTTCAPGASSACVPDSSGTASNVWTSNVWTSKLWDSNVWTSNVWTSNVWTSNVWTSNVWTSNVWTSNAWGVAGWASAQFWSSTWQ